MSKFRGVDFYNMDSLLSEEEKMVRDTVRDFVSREVMPIIAECYREGKFPRQLIPKFAELGLLGANLSGYGCAGMNNVAYGLATCELERGDSGIRSFASVQSSLVMYPIYTFGSEEQKNKYLPKLAKGELVGCFGLTEPDFGSNPGGLKTTAIKKDNSYILNGAKMWITNGSMADISIVWAKMDGKVHGFIVEKGTKGFTTKEMVGKLSLRASDTSELILEDCEVPLSSRMPNVDGLKSALMCLNQARYGIAWGAIGAAMACYDEAVNYSKTRIQFGKPIGSFQLVQHKLACMLTEITKAQLLCLRLGRLKDEGKANYVQVSLAKRNNVYEALKIARMARDILGANGIIDEYQSMRHAANLETVYTYEGTHDIHTLIIGEHITGIPAFS
ncbi:MAG: acyl-CoA dehydrogenase [Candidatus Schekmanbacteria bacterium RBG_16_38_10]|uniref:Acyl-CoA dehydrogenase n=1 Tax=Candidatus Schekmanbacteria bacterium RBG_16_38_10 TaxID=1817879 RepID=A0A1F7RVQ7_9BACT|nr:MAG: acyl-CoA dehydrogenase [Candidatus Schekmanbacteria bacterium RBG_16_38_10]